MFNLASKTLSETGLKGKGVIINWYSDEALKDIREKAKVKKITDIKTFLEKIKLLKLSQTKACYSHKQNKVHMYGKGSTLSVFHEMGHSMNWHFGKK